jgi:hypothetical protein
MRFALLFSHRSPQNVSINGAPQRGHGGGSGLTLMRIGALQPQLPQAEFSVVAFIF